MVNYTEESENLYNNQMYRKYNTINSIEKSFEDRILDYNRPKYYGGAGNTYEVFNVLEAWGLDEDFYLGNVIKYMQVMEQNVNQQYLQPTQQIKDLGLVLLTMMTYGLLIQQ